MTVIGRYERPSGLKWVLADGTEGTIAPVIVKGEDVTVYPAWTSRYYTFQCQTRYRRRKSPANTTDTAGGEEWEDWSDWSGTITDGEVASTRKDGNVSRLVTGYTASKTFTAYDATDLQFRVRVHNQGDYYTSEWSTSTVRIRYVPKATITSITAASDGGADVTVETDWTRGGSTLSAGNWYPQAYPKSRVLLPTISMAGLSDDFTFRIPPEAIVGGKAYAGNVRMTTADGASDGRYTFSSLWTDDGDAYVFEVGSHSDATTVPEPTLTAKDDDGDLRVAVVSAGDDYDDVFAWVSWTGPDGTAHRDQLDMAEAENGSWLDLYACPPLNVDLTVTANVVVGNEWRTATTTAMVESPYTLLTWEGERVEARWNVSRQGSGEHASEQVTVAGRELPVSRHGSQRTKAIELSAHFWEDEQRPSDFDVLGEPHDWTLRLPDGYRHLVSVSSWSVSSDKWSRVWSVSIKCSEVSDD